jgi:hypothetical protein
MFTTTNALEFRKFSQHTKNELPRTTELSERKQRDYL